jgi:hypothetical protein
VPKVQLLHRNLIAQFYKSKDDPPVFHYIITRQGSDTIIAWSQCETLADCQREAAESMKYLLNDDDIPPMDFDEDDLEPLAI